MPQAGTDAHLQAFCDDLAQEQQANVIVVRCCGEQFVVAAAAPWRLSLQPLDRVAVDWCFRLKQPTGFGSDRSAGSDWLFLPVSLDGDVALALGVAGRNARRRFSPRRLERARQNLEGLCQRSSEAADEELRRSSEAICPQGSRLPTGAA